MKRFQYVQDFQLQKILARNYLIKVHRAETEFKVINTEIQNYSKTEINKENSCKELLDQGSRSRDRVQSDKYRNTKIQ